MVESAQLQQHAQALQQQKEFQTGELQNRQRLADLHEKQLQQQHDQFMEHLNKVLIPQVKSAAEAERLKNMDRARTLITSGMSPEAFRQQPIQGVLPGAGSFTVPGTPEGMLDIPGVGRQPRSAYPTPAESTAIEAQRVKGIATAQHEAAEPFTIRDEERKFTNAKALKDFENQFTERLTDKKIASEEKMAKWNNDTRLAIERGTTAMHLQIAGMQYVPTPENLRAMVVAGLTGETKLNYANPQERAALGVINQMGGRPPDPTDMKALQQGQTLAPLFDKLEQFASKHLPDEEGPSGYLGARGAAWLQGGLAATGLPIDVKNQISQIKPQALNTARAIEGLTGGRVTNQQMALALEALTSPGITKQMALERIQNLRDMYINKEQNILLGGMPEAQKDLIYKTYGIKPGWLMTAPKTNATGHPLNEQKSLEVGHPVWDLNK